METMGGILALTLVLLVANAVLKRRERKYRSLAGRQPERRSGETPLGMEATDMDLVNRVARQNESLERAHTNWTTRKSGFLTQGVDTNIDGWDDDETYAARYHAAFHKKQPKD
ncbi:MAG: hypothetical protein AAF755_09685 [Pseudomonadota bacterium]